MQVPLHRYKESQSGDPSETMNPTDSYIIRVIEKDGRIEMMLTEHVDRMSVAGNKADCELHKRFPKKSLEDLISYTG